jgi:hypothetical protein
MRAGVACTDTGLCVLQVVKQSSDHLRVGRGGEEERQLLNE